MASSVAYIEERNVRRDNVTFSLGQSLKIHVLNDASTQPITHASYIWAHSPSTTHRNSSKIGSFFLFILFFSGDDGWKFKFPAKWKIWKIYLKSWCLLSLDSNEKKKVKKKGKCFLAILIPIFHWIHENVKLECQSWVLVVRVHQFFFKKLLVKWNQLAFGEDFERCRIIFN